jgi:hypothetical protein
MRRRIGSSQAGDTAGQPDGRSPFLRHPGPSIPRPSRQKTGNRIVEAAGAVDAQIAPTSSLENHRAGFPQLPQRLFFFSFKNKNNGQTEASVLVSSGGQKILSLDNCEMTSW